MGGNHPSGEFVHLWISAVLQNDPGIIHRRLMTGNRAATEFAIRRAWIGGGAGADRSSASRAGGPSFAESPPRAVLGRGRLLTGWGLRPRGSIRRAGIGSGAGSDRRSETRAGGLSIAGSPPRAMLGRCLFVTGCDPVGDLRYHAVISRRFWQAILSSTQSRPLGLRSRLRRICVPPDPCRIAERYGHYRPPPDGAGSCRG